MEYLKDLRKGMIIGFGIVLTIGIAGLSYAALSSLKATNNETLTVSKWNSLVDHTVPSTAVMAFASSSCPTGWSEYLPAQGRFIRGIDKTGTLIDPDGERSLGDTQEDELKSHSHVLLMHRIGNPYPDYGAMGSDDSVNGNPNPPHNPIKSTGGSETRPKNVALLYCIKD